MKKLVYLVGIKGVAMTALAVYLTEKGDSVTGSDVTDTFSTDDVLKKCKIKVKQGFSIQNIDKKYDEVIVTGAHGGATNIESQFTKKMGIPTYMHGIYLGKIMSQKYGISVAGCHGKTTTSCMSASLLHRAGLDPSWAIGTSHIQGLGFGGHYGRGNYFIAEADEYVTCPKTDPTPRFLWQHPHMLILTNIEYDHPDVYKDLSEVQNAYIQFTKNVSKDGIVIACIDDKNIQKILPSIQRRVLTYGFSPQADYRIVNSRFGKGLNIYTVVYKEINLGDFILRVPGTHNALNALAASIAANNTGIDWETIRIHTALYIGSKRRFEKIAEYKNFVLIDDYAHHPSEIFATLNAAKKWFGEKKIIVIFQPHTYSRTRSLLTEFAKSFTQADCALITEIYPSAREKFDHTISSKLLVEKAGLYKANVVYTAEKSHVLDWLLNNLNGDEVVFTMGAGDIFSWQNDILDLFKRISH